MATRQYIGARYVPKFYDFNGSPEWRSGVAYENLTIVTRNGNSYTSKKPVPSNIGEPENNPEYWVSTGIYNEQIETYRQLTLAVSDKVDDLAADGAIGTNNLANGSITSDKLDSALSKEVKNGYITPEMYGAVGDGVTDDTAAVQECLNHIGKYTVAMFGKYLISSPVIIHGHELKIIGNGIIIYNGEDYAIKMHGVFTSTFELCMISAPNGSGILFYCENADDWNQYVNLYIDFILAKNECIGMHKTSGAGWTNEIRINNTRLCGDVNHTIGVRIEGPATNGWSLINVGIEGVKTGLYMDGDNVGAAIINPRAAESFRYVAETTGSANLMLLNQNLNISPNSFNFSNQTRGTILGIIYDDGYSIESCSATIYKGIINYSQLANRVRGFKGVTNFDIANETNEKYITTAKIDNNSTFKLSDLYASPTNGFGIKEFKVVNTSTNYVQLIVYDHSNNLIFTTDYMIPHSTYCLSFDGQAWNCTVENPPFNAKRVSIADLTLTNCTYDSANIKKNGYVIKDGFVYVNIRVTASDTSFTISGLPGYVSGTSKVFAPSSAGTGIITPDGVLSVTGVQVGYDVMITATYPSRDI